MDIIEVMARGIFLGDGFEPCEWEGHYSIADCTRRSKIALKALHDAGYQITKLNNQGE